MFYRLIKFIVVSCLLCLAFAAKADMHAHKTEETKLTVKEHFHAEIFAEDSALASVLNSQVPHKQVTTHRAFALHEPLSLLKNPDCTFAQATAARNDQMPKRVLLILFPFHVFW